MIDNLKKQNRGILIILGYTAISATNAVGSSFYTLATVRLSDQAATMVITTFLLGLCAFVSIYGMLKYKRWGLNLLKAIYTLLIVMTGYVLVSDYFAKDVGSTALQILEVIVAIAILLYTSKKKSVKRFIKKNSSASRWRLVD